MKKYVYAFCTEQKTLTETLICLPVIIYFFLLPYISSHFHCLLLGV